jgi:hypothetical protein
MGNGRHAFSYALPPVVRDGKRHTIRVAIARTGPDLLGSPKTFQSPPMARPATGEGSFDGIDGGTIGGWAWDPKEPDRPVRVEVYDGKTLLAAVAADQLRPDLLKGKMGNGRHAFSYVLPPGVRDGKPHTIRVAIAGAGPDLLGSPKTFQSPPMARPATGEGSFDGIDGGTIGGWVWDPKDPDRPVRVEVYDGKTLLAAVVADQLRPDLLKAKMGNGRHAFSYVLPPGVRDGKPHTIRVAIAGAGQDLPGSPKTFQSPPAARPEPEGRVDSFSEGSIGGWAWDPGKPNRAVRVEVYDGNTLLATVAADQLRQDLLKAKMGNGRHGFTYDFPAALKDGKAHTIRVKLAAGKKELAGSPRVFKITGNQAKP